MCSQYSANLLVNSNRRMKSSGRFLEDQRNISAANGLELIRLRFEKILPLVQDRATCNDGVAVEQPQQRYRKRAFS